MRNIPFSPPDITELEIQEVCEALRSGWITTGPRTKQLEKELAEYCHVAKLVCLNSATAAEEMNLRVWASVKATRCWCRRTPIPPRRRRPSMWGPR